MKGGERYKVETWYDVPTRKGKRSKEDGGLKKDGPVVTKFFVLNLPGGCASTDLYEVLKGFGMIHGIYIARKYDKLGKRFGFVSFAKVKDPIVLERDLKDVWIGSFKLFIVLARFVDGEKIDWTGNKRWEPVGEKKNDEKVQETVPVMVNDQSGPSSSIGRSFRDTLVGKEVEKNVEEIVIDDDLIGDAHWNGLGLLGTTRGLVELTGLREWLDSIRLNKVGIRYVGGLSVILVFKEKECEENIWS